MSEQLLILLKYSVSVPYQDTRESSQACEAGSTPVSRSSIDNQTLTSFFTIKT
nr:MAG TPA: hypothetical protein [Caudoviricetes sp.]